ncbi:MAG TPA: hypothetical protein VJ963_11475, partial [Bacteroidales bacterium]|nr:hypothetical protein [Bacteroidales bacterium]
MGTSEILYVKRITVLFLAVLFLGTTSIIKAVPGNAGEALNDLLPHFVSHAGPDSVSRHKRTNIYSSDSLFSFRSRKGYFPSLLHNTAEQAAAPFHFRKKELFLSGSVVLLTAGLTCSDGLTDDYTKVLKSRHEWIRRASPVITSFGSRSGYGTVIVFGTMSAIFKNKKGVETSFLVSQALLTSGLWVQVIKILAGRQRPFRYDITG